MFGSRYVRASLWRTESGARTVSFWRFELEAFGLISNFKLNAFFDRLNFAIDCVRLRDE